MVEEEKRPMESAEQSSRTNQTGTAEQPEFFEMDDALAEDGAHG